MCTWPYCLTVMFMGTSLSFLIRQLSVISSDGECPSKMSTKRRLHDKKPPESPPPKKGPSEKLIQAEGIETGTVRKTCFLKVHLPNKVTLI